MRAYKNSTWDLIDNFFDDFNITFVPRDLNQQVGSLDLTMSTFKPPKNPRIKYDVEMWCRQSI